MTRTYSRETVISKLVEAMATEGPTPFAARCGVALPTLYAYRQSKTRVISDKVLAALGLVRTATVTITDAPTTTTRGAEG